MTGSDSEASESDAAKATATRTGSPVTWALVAWVLLAFIFAPLMGIQLAGGLAGVSMAVTWFLVQAPPERVRVRGVGVAFSLGLILAIIIVGNYLLDAASSPGT